MTEAGPIPSEPFQYSWVPEAYERMRQLEESELPVAERVAQVLADYPDSPPPPDSESEQLPALQVKFKQFSDELLGTSPDIAAFQERVSFLFSTDFRRYYVRTGRDKRQQGSKLVERSIRAAHIGISGLATFCERHPEDIDAAVAHVTDHLKPIDGTAFAGGNPRN